jgi:hypothetical protein
VCATFAREIVSPSACQSSGFGRQRLERDWRETGQSLEPTFAIVRRLTRYDKSLESVSNVFMIVIHHAILRCDSGRKENFDASKRRIRLPDATFPPRN